jgi:hypothetical protein
MVRLETPSTYSLRGSELDETRSVKRKQTKHPQRLPKRRNLKQSNFRQGPYQDTNQIPNTPSESRNKFLFILGLIRRSLFCSARLSDYLSHSPNKSLPVNLTDDLNVSPNDHSSEAPIVPQRGFMM